MMQRLQINSLHVLTILGLVFFGFQVWALIKPMEPMYERAAHVTIALFILFIAHPIAWKTKTALGRLLQIATLLGVAFCTYYYASQLPRLTTRIENVDAVEQIDHATATRQRLGSARAGVAEPHHVADGYPSHATTAR